MYISAVSRQTTQEEDKDKASATLPGDSDATVVNRNKDDNDNRRQRTTIFQQVGGGADTIRLSQTMTAMMLKSTTTAQNFWQKTTQQSNRLERESIEEGKMIMKAKSAVRQQPPMY